MLMSIPVVRKQFLLALCRQAEKKTVLRFLTMTSNKCGLIAVCQLNSTSDRRSNFETCVNLINNAANRGAKMVFLPECFDHVGESKKQSVELAEPLDGALLDKYKQLAKNNSIHLSLGGFHEKGSGEDVTRVYNSHVVIDSKGSIVSVYRKIHLFDMEISGGVQLKESDYTIPGNQVVPPVATPVGNVGLGICYDLRFPEFSLCLAKAGAEILTYPSAFTQATGMAHWESLLRSRAIENQCYVVAAAQTGRHNPKRSSYGHAMVIDPWGCVIASCSEGIGMVLTEINLEYVKKIRLEMPVWKHRRTELYGSILSPCNNKQNSSTVQEKYMFGTIPLLPEQLFYSTKYSMAFVNKKCVVPGHVLVAPLRCARRLGQLSSDEAADLFQCVQSVQQIVEKEYSASSSTISIQDGPDAGQTIAHLHVHVLPRKPGDFQQNDDIYHELESHDKTDSNWRTNDEMLEEAKRLRQLSAK